MSSPYSPLSVADYYRHLFPARTDVYSHWTQDGWRPVREELTAEVVVAGLSRKGPSISGYMIAPPGVSHTIAIDFDRDDGLKQAVRLGRLMWGSSIPAWIETSRRGAHLWAPLDEVTPATVIRMGIRGMLQSLGLDAHDPKIELRPGSDTISKEGLGHCLRLPMMPHPKTGKRGQMLDPRNPKHPFGASIADALLRMAEAQGSSASLLEWAERYKPPPVPEGHSPPEYHKPNNYPEDDSTASEILRTLWGLEQPPVPGRAIKCPAHDDTKPSLMIMRDDRRAICWAPHCILNNHDRGRGTYELRKLAPHEQ